MKKLNFSKIACGVMFGLVMPVGMVHAADANDRIQASLGGDGRDHQISMSYDSSDSWSTPRGAQGPIRSDMTEDKLSDSDKAAHQREMDRLFPLNATGG